MDRVSTTFYRPSQSFQTLESADVSALYEAERSDHFRRSLKMTVLTLCAGIAMFALFFGLVALCERM